MNQFMLKLSYENCISVPSKNFLILRLGNFFSALGIDFMTAMKQNSNRVIEHFLSAVAEVLQEHSEASGKWLNNYFLSVVSCLLDRSACSNL